MSRYDAVPALEPPVRHIVHNGRAMCGLPGDPYRWPAPHKPVPITEHYKTNCQPCFYEWVRFYDSDD